MSTFEDEFSEAQSDLISITLEYSSKRADDIYLLFSFVGGLMHVDTFFTQANRAFHRNELPGIDTSEKRENVLFKYWNDGLNAIYDACKKYGRPLPMEGYLHYRVGGALDARYSYEDIGPDDDLPWDDHLEAWRASVQQSLDAQYQ